MRKRYRVHIALVILRFSILCIASSENIHACINVTLPNGIGSDGTHDAWSLTSKLELDTRVFAIIDLSAMH